MGALRRSVRLLGEEPTILEKEKRTKCIADSMTVVDLKKRLKQLKLPVSGVKSDLIDRLMKADPSAGQEARGSTNFCEDEGSDLKAENLRRKRARRIADGISTAGLTEKKRKIDDEKVSAVICFQEHMNY